MPFAEHQMLVLKWREAAKRWQRRADALPEDRIGRAPSNAVIRSWLAKADTYKYCANMLEKLNKTARPNTAKQIVRRRKK